MQPKALSDTGISAPGVMRLYLRPRWLYTSRPDTVARAIALVLSSLRSILIYLRSRVL